MFRGKVIYPEKGKVDYPQKQNMKMNKALFGIIYGIPNKVFFHLHIIGDKRKRQILRLG